MINYDKGYQQYQTDIKRAPSTGNECLSFNWKHWKVSFTNSMSYKQHSNDLLHSMGQYVIPEMHLQPKRSWEAEEQYMYQNYCSDWLTESNNDRSLNSQNTEVVKQPYCNHIFHFQCEK